MEIFIFNEVKEVSSSRLKKVIHTILRWEKAKTDGLAVVFLEAKEIKKLNFKYRQKNYPTDVLSFEDKERDYLGEVIICPAEIRKNARQSKINFKEELARVLIHGILHLLGYDHQKSREQERLMIARQELYLSKIKLS